MKRRGTVAKLIKRSHQWIDARDLAMCRLIAKKIRRDPTLLNEAVETLKHWKRIQKPCPAWLKEWDYIFRKHSSEEVLKILTQDSEEGNRLRQSDPFCGVLTETERLRFLDEYEAK